MGDEGYYRAMARQCLEMAKRAARPETRQALIAAGLTWMQMAENPSGYGDFVGNERSAA